MDQLAPTARQLALILKGRRKSMGLSQAHAAARMDLLAKTVSALESRPERCRVESLYRLLAALDLELVLRAKRPGPLPHSSDDW